MARAHDILCGGRRLILALLVACVALISLGATSAGAAPPHAKAKGGKLIVAPKRGQVINANVAKVSIRTGRGLRIRLNGRWIPAKELGRARRGVRSMQASLSHGLRAGTNVLTVKLRRHGHRRRATVRFRVEPPGPLIGAGRDDVATVGEDVRLAGRIEPGATPAKESIAWTPLRLPEDTEPSCDPGGDETALRSPAGLSANFTPRLPGEYVYRLTDHSNPGEPTDIVPVTVVYKNRMVPVETIITGDPVKRGIRVGRLTYLVSKAQVAPGADHSGLQVLVLKRRTLECVSNTRYRSATELGTALKEIKSSDLVIVAMQPGSAPGQVDGKALYDALGAIGFPAEDDKTLPTSGGSFSGIGVGEYKRGDADVNIVPQGSNEVAAMTGVLAVDQFNNFGYIPTLSEPFKWAIDEPIEPCANKGICEDYIGYFVRIQNPRTGKTVKENLFPTAAPKYPEDRVDEMIKMIEGAPTGDVVQVVASSDRLASENTYPSSLGPIKQSTYNRLVNAIVSVGGTRNAFNKTAMTRGSLASSGQTYALVGWKGAKEGEGAEAAAHVFGQGGAPRLIGELRPNQQSLLRPTLETEAATHTNVADVVMWKPTEKWPLEDDPGEMRALAYLGEKLKLGPEPRLEYWAQAYTPDTWKDYGGKVEGMKYSDVPAAERAKFTEAEFKATVAEFSNELTWVGKTRDYMNKLAEPFSKKTLESWAKVEEMAKEIYAETHATDAETSLRWVEFTSIMLKLAGPLTGHISNTLGEVMDLGVWGFGASEAGRPTYTEVSLKATEVAGELRTEMENAVGTYKAMARAIVSDPAKLKKIGTETDCSPREPKCNREFLFTEDMQIQAGADISRSIRRLAYEKLLPTFYETYKLNRDRYPEQVSGKTRQIGTYLCKGVAYPFSNHYRDPKVIEETSANLLQELDLEHGGKRNAWQTLVLSEITGSTEGSPPATKILEDMFKPLPEEEGDYNTKGLGMNPEEFLAGQHWHLWDQAGGVNPPEDACVWN